MTRSQSACDILLFVEDPGAANFVPGLPTILGRHGWRSYLATSGAATEYLAARGLASNFLPADTDADALIEGLKAKVIAVGTGENPNSLSHRLVRAAAARNIRSIGLVDSAVNAAHRLRGGSAHPLEFCPDLLIVTDTMTRDAFTTLGLAQSRIIVSGHPHWDYVRSQIQHLQSRDRALLRQELFHVAPRGQTAILFASEVSAGVDSMQFQRSSSYTLAGSGVSRGRTEIVIEEFLLAAAPRRSELYLVLRLHPKQSPRELARYVAEFDFVSQIEPPLECLFAVDAVVGMTSMLMTEAALLQRPTLAIIPRQLEMDWLPTIEAGVTACAFTRAAVASQLATLIERPRSADVATLERLFPSGSCERVAVAIGRFIRDRP
jgi:hypothetical protein